MSQSKIVGALAGLALLAGCGGENTTPPPSEEVSQGMSWEEFLAGVYQEPDTGIFIADGDTPFASEKHLREFYENNVRNGQLIVHTAGGVDAAWNATQKKNITYCVSSSSFGTRYNTAVAAMKSAAEAWEAVANVDFVHVVAQDGNCTASNGNVVFDVRIVNSGNQYLARAFFPNDTRANRNVLIDTSAFGSIPPWTLEGILRHELGHTLGFRHEHTRPQAGTCFEDNNWRQLTAYDSASVMHYPQCNGTQNGDLVITALDAQGAVALYGAPGGTDPEPPGPGTGTPTTTTLTGSVAASTNNAFPAINVVPGTAFNVTMTGTGDPDLYVRFGAAPTTTTYNCRPYLSGASESCNLTVPAGVTTAYVMVRGYTAATFTLTINYTRPDAGGTPATDTKSGSVASGSVTDFPAYTVVAGSTFKVVMTGSGDPDLYVRFGSAPTTTAYNCRPYQTGAAETCELTVPAGQTSAYVQVRGYTAGTYNLAISYTKP
ncbi:M57 family metalloprotease [Myxococcus faecalis]|uniref:M57 family metalloprotease n=1 Tax=Myxococcus TaxID=32 RepID=UPI001CBADBC8|nr:MULTISPECIES: M57 family metalloprotease [unclassified Myxococcus]MBZ4395848.1 matrixin family metalloprotease [Myxococcus sp. AS-1-15]MBZ4411466.1 matrixin family metalloprotease [Myxococcus sp. XM-1-1-1]BDT31211.1 M57 family metalloprotease [Myxococcus sp. MH1]